jgi:hypothetical protein
MAYLIDSNGFIQPKNYYYGMDFCPAYWQWLEANCGNGLVLSIDRVYAEIQAKHDDLSVWASELPSSIFLPSTDADTIACYARVLTWVRRRQMAQGQQFYKTSVQNDFFDGSADPYLIAYALAHNHTVVTLESSNADQRNKVLIPVVCDGLDVPWLPLFDMLRLEQARFTLV